MNRNFTILILFCLLTASACGILSGEKTARKLVSLSDAEKIMGVPMKFETEKFDERQSSCRYTDGDSNLHLEIKIQEYVSEEQAQEALGMMQDLNRRYGSKIQPLEDIGGAAWFENREFSQAIYARRKNFAFLIVAEGGELSEQRLGELRRVAESVAARL